MTDIRIAPPGTPTGVVYEAVTLDFLLTDVGDLDTSQELATAVTVALLTDALASPDDILPDVTSTDRRGWWGDLDGQEIWDGWPIGSKLWLLSRERLTQTRARQGSTTAKIEAYIREALEPMIARRIASRVDVRVTRFGLERVDAAVALYRGPKSAISMRFDDLWGGVVLSAPTGF